jgi:YD repeat-containing protein
MNRSLKCLTLLLAIAAACAFAEDEMRDFYAEPGLNPFSSGSGQDATENIDPFSGNVQLSYLDLLVPGNGGLDIAITRYYNLPQSSPGYANPFGYGWTMHFGRITIGSGHAMNLCGTGVAPGADTLDNPSIEMPDGGRELLVHSSALGDGTYITRSNWKAACIDAGDYTRGIVATSPEGTAYYMREYVFMQGEDGPAGEPAPTVETWLTNRIVDASGNSIDISYLTIGNGMKLVTRLDASDGRRVEFSYLDTDGFPVTAASINAHLSEIEANGQRWAYRYAQVGEVSQPWGAVHHYKLTAVVRPDGTQWQYRYGDAVADPGFNRLTGVIYPSGGQVNYSYQRVRPWLPDPDFQVVAIRTKTQHNPGGAEGTWAWEFLPGYADFADLGVEPLPENAGRMADFTRITTPVGVEHVYHVGYRALENSHDLLWEMGLKLRHDYFSTDPGDGALTLVRSVSNGWDALPISGEVYRGGIQPALWDEQVYAPLLTRREVVLDGYLYATGYAGHDAFGNPGRITEYAIFPSENGDRVTDISYLNDTGGWFIGLPEVETVTQDGEVAGTVSRSYDSHGRLQSEERFGVLTRYTYTGEGDVASVTDARGNTTWYGDYFRGTARRVDYPDGTARTRVVNPTGSVAARTSGRGHTTAFGYDGLNRLTAIDYPIGSDVSVAWSASGKSLTRGSYRESLSWDGFGRERELTREDTGTGLLYRRRYDHDALGRRIFESDWNSPEGMHLELDTIGRVTRETNQDGSFRAITHEGAHRELHRDENGEVTDYRFQVYGDPGQRSLLWTLSPEGVGTNTRRDAWGNITYLFQGGLDPTTPGQYLGYPQYWAYNERLQLTALDSPADVGLISYGRDPLGNMISRQVGESPVAAYAYDRMNRLESIDYPGDAIDVSYGHDADGNVTAVANGLALRSYDYDANGNLSRERITIGGNSYEIGYTHDALDFVADITYPSGRRVEYHRDALGRPGAALPYVTGVSYYPDGSLQQVRYGNGRSVAYTRTARHWLDTLTVSGLAALDYDYDGAGNVIAITDGLDAARNRQMSYDRLGRLTSASGNWGVASYEYDAFSNMVRKSDPATGNRDLHYDYLGLRLDRISYSDSAAQRVFSYDAWGNITYGDEAVFDPFTGFPLEVRTTRQQLFDAAGNMTFTQRSARDGYGNYLPLASGSFSSEYDGEGHRVKKIDHSEGNRWTDYLYTGAGQLLGEYDASGAYYGKEYFYLGTSQVATAKLNAPPLVDAGGALRTWGGNITTITATHSDTDGAVVAVAWTQISGPAVVIDDPAAGSTSFVAPEVSGEQAVVLQFAATDDRGGVATALLTVTIDANRPPRADAGADREVLAGSPVQLDGSNSSDPEGELSFQWAGDYLREATVASPVADLPDPGYDYSKTYTLTVTDSGGLTDSDTVTLQVLTALGDADGDGLSDGWEVVNFGGTGAHGGADDPDADGLSNAREQADGTDPNSANQPGAVSSLAVLRGDGESVLVWERPPAAAIFRVYWSTDAGLPLADWQQEEVAERYFHHAGLTNGARYHYLVVAANALGSSAPSPAVSGAPDAPGWRAPQPPPASLSTLDPTATRVATNRFGDTAVLSEKLEDGRYRLYVWQRMATGGWGGAELLSEEPGPHHFSDVAIDNEANVLVAWSAGAPGARDLYAAYRPYGRRFGAGQLVENYPATSQVDGDVVGLHGLAFAADGSASLCWRQNRKHVFDNFFDPDGASAIVKLFHPARGWFGEHNLEVMNNVGDTRSLNCDMAGDGRMVAAWGRGNTYSPEAMLNAFEADVWVAVYDPEHGWSPSETVEFLGSGIAGDNDLNSAGSRAAVHGAGRAVVVWYDGDAADIQSLEYDFPARRWLAQETLESRDKRVSPDESLHLAAGENGSFVVAWGQSYRTRTAGQSGWERVKSLPAAPEALRLDLFGQPVTVHYSGTDIVASRLLDDSWRSAVLNGSATTGAKALGLLGTALPDSALVYWFSGESLMASSDEPRAAPPPADASPVTTLSVQVQKVQGASRYTLSLSANAPAATWFRFSGQGAVEAGGVDTTGWQVYGEPVVIQLEKKGSGSFEYYSESADGLVEAAQTQVLR